MALNNSASTDFINEEYLNFYKCMLKLNNQENNEKSNCLSLNSIFRVFELIIDGMDGDSKKNIDNSPAVKQLIAAAPKPTKRRSGVFIRGGYNFDREYFRKHSTHAILDDLPVTQPMVNDINAMALSKFPDMEGNFYDKPANPSCRLHIIDESFFNGVWYTEFDIRDTHTAPFYLDEKTSKDVQMMKAEPLHIKIYSDKAKGCKFINLPYKYKNKMLVILPDKAMNKKELVEFCLDELSGSDIANFYQKSGISRMCSYVTMPRFEFDCTWNLDQHFEEPVVKKFCPYLTTIFDNKKLNLKKMVTNFELGFDSIELCSKTKVVNFEKGTMVTTRSDIMCFDCMKQDAVEVEINRGFLFAIVDANNKISNFGLYCGK